MSDTRVDAGGVGGQVATMWSGGCTDAGGVRGQVATMWSGGCTDAGGVRGQLGRHNVEWRLH